MKKKIFVGLFAGFISGFFATGGGLILVPAFIHIFKLKETNARATSVASMLPMIFVSGIFYLNNNYINWKIGIMCAIGGVVGGIIGAKLLKKLPEKFLKISFIIFLSYMSVKLVF